MNRAMKKSLDKESTRYTSRSNYCGVECVHIYIVRVHVDLQGK